MNPDVGRVPTRPQARRPRGVVALIALWLIAGCTAAPQIASPSPSGSTDGPAWPSDTSYGRLFSQVGADGSVSKDLALLAFSTAIAPLPGVPVAPGGSPNDHERADGTFAINWIRGYLDELTAEQRAVVDRALKPSESGRLVEPNRPVANLGGGFGPLVAADDPAKPYTDAIASAESTIGARLHRDLKQHIWFDFGEAPPDPNKNPNLGDTLAFAWTDGDPGPNLVCAIRATSAMAGASQLRINVVMAHEVFHCFQFEARPDRGRTKVLDWIVEGQAEWVGEDVAGPSQDGVDWWSVYLKSPGESLWKRSYDAVGFYEHLAETGTSPWTVFDKMLATPTDSIEAFKAAGAVDDNFLDTWASGMLRADGLTAAWYAQGRWTTSAQAPEDFVRIANADSKELAASPVTNLDRLIGSLADITELSFQGHVRMYTSGVDTPQVSVIDLCTMVGDSTCKCPEGTSYNGPPLTPSDGFIHLALTGSLSGASGTVRGRPLSDFCKPIPTPKKGTSPRGGKNPCVKGCGQSVGDPHMHTIDQKEYDFQAAGEFVLLRSPDGSIEIQARQAPYPEVADASITTALAWRVAGHRVAMYEQGAESGYSLTLDGNPLDPLTVGTMDLGQGAALTALEDGVEVAYGDGTIAQAIFHGNGFAHALDILVAPSDAFRAQATGLIGPLAAGSELPALPDGTSLPLSQDRATRFAQRYEQLAAAWHVTDQTSLFDYQPGETTATFDVPNFPSENTAFTVEELEQQQGVVEFQKATEQCAAVGGDPQTVLHCVFDIMATKDPAYADFYALVQQFLVNGPEALDGPTVEFTPPPPPTPSGLPAGFVQVATDVSSVKGAAIAPDGMLYASLLRPGFTADLISVDTATGNPGPSGDVTGAGAVFLLDGSLWAAQDDLSGNAECILERFDPVTLASQVELSIGCDLAGPQAVPVADGVWWLDRSTSDGDGHGAMIRHIDPATNAVDRSVELPFVNGWLSSSSTTVVFGDTATDKGWFRLLPGATSFVPLAVSNVGFGLHPQGEGVWLQPVQSAGTAQAVYVTESATPDRVIPIDGILAGADDQAIYVEALTSDPDALMRYAFDGSPPTVVLTSTTLTTSDGSQDLRYSGGDPVVIGDGKIAKMWLVRDWPADGTSSLIAQATTIP